MPKVCKIADVRTLGSSASSWGDTKLDKVWATWGQRATFLTRGGDFDARWAGLVPRASTFDDGSGGARRRIHRPDSAARDARYAAAVDEAAGEPDDIDWDDVVDIVSVGQGPGALAAAIGASRGGMRVFVVDSWAGDDATGDDADSLSGRLGVTDADTVEYFDALTQDVAPLTRRDSGQLPTRTIDGPRHPETGQGTIATFVGSALRNWADRCLASPGGVLHTNLAHPAMTATYASPGGILEAVVVGSIDIENGQPTERLDDWLAWRAEELGISQPESTALQRLVFDAGQVVGAILDTPIGSRAVRARSGVIIETGAGMVAPSWTACGLGAASSATVALVTRPASRFARLELLVPPANRITAQ